MGLRNNKNRIGFPKKYKGVMDWLKLPDKESDAAVSLGAGDLFKTRAHALIFAAAYGFHLGGPREEDKGLPSMGDIRPKIFRDHDLLGFIDVIALASTEDITILADEKEDERRIIFYEHMARGLDKLKNLQKRNLADPLAVLRDLLETVGAPESQSQDNLRKELP